MNSYNFKLAAFLFFCFQAATTVTKSILKQLTGLYYSGFQCEIRRNREHQLASIGSFFSLKIAKLNTREVSLPIEKLSAREYLLERGGQKPLTCIFMFLTGSVSRYFQFVLCRERTLAVNSKMIVKTADRKTALNLLRILP